MPRDANPSDRSLDRTPEALREACARVAAGSSSVRVGPKGAGPLADDLLALGALDDVGAVGDPWAVDPADAEAAIALVLTLAAINFGSGWHPVVAKRPGMSGATSMATAIRDWSADVPITAERLVDVDLLSATVIFGQPDDDPAVAELMGLFAAALVELGETVRDRFGGSFTRLVESADGSAVELVGILTTMVAFDDTSEWTSPEGEHLTLHFDKRAQLAAADLHRTFGGDGPGRFDDLDRLTAFADNLVPHVLALDGVLEFDPVLRDRIDAGGLLDAGSREEVEIRALGVHGVELLRTALLERGSDVPSWQLDGVLWRRGGGAHYKSLPRHRARSRWY